LRKLSRAALPLLLVLGLFTAAVFAEYVGFNSLWARSYGGYSDEYFRAVVAVSDGYLSSGNVASWGAGASDMYLVKTALNGDLVFNESYGGEGSDYVRAMMVEDDGSIILVGDTRSYGTGDPWSGYMVKTNSTGGVVWETVFGSDQLNGARGVVKLPGGGYAVCGEYDPGGVGAYKDIVIWVFDSGGGLLENHTYGTGASYERARWMITASDGNLVIAGLTNDPAISAGGYDALLLKVDVTDFSRLWNKTLGKAGENDLGYGVCEASAGGYVVSGETGTVLPGSPMDVAVWRTDAAGDEVWNYTTGDDGEDLAYRVIEVQNNAFAAVGTYNVNGTAEIWLGKIDSSGALEYEIFLGPGAGFDLTQDENGDLAVVGSIGSDPTRLAYLVKVEEVTDEFSLGTPIPDDARVDPGVSVTWTIPVDPPFEVNISMSYNGTLKGWFSRTPDAENLTYITYPIPGTVGKYNVTFKVPGGEVNQTYEWLIVDKYILDVYALLSEVEIGLSSLISVNGSSLYDGHILEGDDSVSVNGESLSWNEYTSRFEMIVTRFSAQTNIYGGWPGSPTVTVNEATYGITAVDVNHTAIVSWIPGTLSKVQEKLITGDFTGALFAIPEYYVGKLVFWTSVISAISAAIYNSNGLGSLLLFILLGLSCVGVVIAGPAVVLGVFILVLGGGFVLFRLFMRGRGN